MFWNLFTNFISAQGGEEEEDSGSWSRNSETQHGLEIFEKPVGCFV